MSFKLFPLLEMLDRVYANESVPDNAVAITFDDAYISVYEEAYPRLKKRGWPFTVYVANDPVDRGLNQFISWEQMREMVSTGVEFGGHSATHAHLIRRGKDESKRQWKSRLRQEIDSNAKRIEAELGIEVKSFAYPFGEYNEDVQKLVKKRGYYGLAQQSGAIARTVSPQAIPRYPMMQGYDDRDRLAVALNSRPLPIEITDRLPGVYTVGDRLAPMRFKLPNGPYRAAHLACYAGRFGALEIDASPPHYKLSLPEFGPGRNKINCTAPSSERSGEFFWFSRQWVVKNSDGSWPAE